MSSLEEFEDPRCSKCGMNQMRVLPDYNVEGAKLPGSLGGGMSVYVKSCANCGFTELFLKNTVDAAKALGTKGFGEVIQTPGGPYLLSIFVDYVHAGSSASDFTVPISPDTWMALRLSYDTIPDDELIAAVFPPAYMRAWRQRVGDFPLGFANNLRNLIRRYGKA